MFVRWLFFGVLFVLTVFGVAETSSAQSDISIAQAMQVRFDSEDVVIKRSSDKESLVVNVEVAKTPFQMRVGLMYRQYLGDQAGMLFVYDGKGEVSFWMRNTYLPLDMFFVDDDGVIKHIHKNAKPLDETPVSSQFPVLGVLEMNAGSADKFGINVGDRIFSKNFSNK